MNKKIDDNSLTGIFYMIFCLLIAMIGYNIHKSVFWSIIDFFFAPLVLCKWIIYHEISLSIIEQTFSWFLK